MEYLTSRDWNDDLVIEEALRSYPLVEEPTTLAAGVMLRIRAQQIASASRPIFRLSWLDLAASLCLSLTFMFFLSLGQLIPPPIKEQVRIFALLLWQNIRLIQPWQAAGAVGLVMVILVFAIFIPWKGLAWE